jgi:large repetitive protein
VGQSYSGNLSATGGTPPLSWSAPTGTFPPGLGLSASGAISGTPTAAGAFDFTVRVADSANQTASKPLRITINAAGAPPSITTATLPNATTGVDYSQTIAATGGKAPLTWSISAGALPAGLRLDASTGRITGAPSSVGSFSFTVRATDADSRTGERPLAITVVAALVISGCPVPSGTAGVNYSSSVSAAGGTPPYTWSVSAGQVPPGITLAAATGLFSGTPTATGAFNFTLSAGDSAGRQATRACSIAVSLNLQIINDSLPDATTRAIYSQTLRATGGATPYRWTAIAGSLPPGLTLDENTGLIAGQPTQPGRFSFTVQLTDAAGGQIQRAYTISVGTGLTIPSCPTPVGSVNESYTSTLAAVGGQAPYAWAIDSGTLPQGLRLAADTGVISGTPAAPGASNFSLRASDAGGNTASRACSIQIAPELTITTTSLPQAEAGGAYAAAIVAVGGTPPYVWSISTGSLAPGLTLNAASGQISGTSTAAGAFRFTARVTDAAGIQSDKQFDLTVGSGFVIAACPTPTATVGDPYSSSLSTAGGEAPIAWSISAGSLPTGIALDPQAGTVTGTATAIASSDFVVSATDSKSKATTRACSIAVTAPALSISQPAALADALLGTPYEQTLQASGGRAPYAWSVLSGSLPPGLTLAPGGVISGSASTVGTYSITIRAGDADQRAATRAFDIRVLPAKAPGITFMDLPDIVPPAQQPVVRLKLDSVYPTALRGKLSLRFTPDPGLNVDDPSVRFVTGDRTVDFDIPENSMEAVFPVPQLALQTGSVAGAIDLNVTLASGDLDVSPAPGPARTVRIDRTAPVITNVRLNNVPGGFEVLVTGFATTREVTSATFQFTPATGSRLEASQVTVQTEASAKQWFADTRSANFGSQFTFVQPFTLQNATLSEVTVTLTNAQGTSQPVRARF